MKTLFQRILTNILLLIIIFTFNTILNPALAKSEKEWTMMVYLAGDNDLEYFSIIDILEMEQSINDDVEVIVLYDRSKEHSKLVGDWNETRLYRIKKGNFDTTLLNSQNVKESDFPNNFASSTIGKPSEIDMADPENLEEFIKYTVQNYPAKHYALVMWDHGGGIKGMAQDMDGDGNGHPVRVNLSAEGMSKAIASAIETIPNKKIDLIMFDMCLMGQLDVLYLLNNLTDFVIASPPSEPGQGFDYTKILKILSHRNSVKDTAIEIAKSNAKFYVDHNISDVAYAVYDMSQLNDLVADYISLINSLNSVLHKYYVEITKAIKYSLRYGPADDMENGKESYQTIDLADFAANLVTYLPKSPLSEISKLKNTIEKFVIFKTGTGIFENTNGLAIWFPMRRNLVSNEIAFTPLFVNSGLKQFMNNLYTYQELNGQSEVSITNFKIGKIIPNNYKNNSDIQIDETSNITALAKNVIKFDVIGKEIVSTTISQLVHRNDGTYEISYEAIAIDMNNARTKSKKVSNYSEAILPDYVDGKNTLIREIVGTRYSLINPENNDHQTISLDLSSTYSSFVGYGTYYDKRFGTEMLVEVIFDRNSRQVRSLNVNFGDRNGTKKQIIPQEDGYFRPCVLSYNPQTRRISRELGKKVKWGKTGLLLSPDIVPNGSEIINMITVETISGKITRAFSPQYRLSWSEKQLQMLQNARHSKIDNLVGKYAKLQLFTELNGNNWLPTFDVLEIYNDGNSYKWKLNGIEDKNNQNSVIFINYGLPELRLLSSSYSGSGANVVASWYAFLSQNTTNGDSWYLNSSGDGGWTWLFPLSNYQDGIDGEWESNTETWVFDRDKVLLKRNEKIAQGSFTIQDNVIVMTKMPFDEYSFHLSQDKTQLTLISRKGYVSFLKRKNSANSSKDYDPILEQSSYGADIEGQWINKLGVIANFTKLSNSKWYRLSIQGKNVHMNGIFGIQNNQMLITYDDNSKEIWTFEINNDCLTISVDGNTIEFSRFKK